MRLFIKKNISSLTDPELLARYRESHDKKWIGELFSRYSHLVFGLCLNYFPDKDDSKDAVMKIFEKLYAELQKREIENFKSWLTFVSKNHCISELRKIKTRENHETNFGSMISADDNEKETALEKDLELDRLSKAMNRLNPDQKLCIGLFFLEEKSYKEISIETGFSENQVKSHLQNGKRNLKIFLSEMKLHTIVNQK